MLKHFVRGKTGWWILHLVAVALVVWLGHFIRF